MHSRGGKGQDVDKPKILIEHMTNEQRKQLIRQHGADICEFCERQFPYAGNCLASTCRCAEDAYFDHINKPHP